MISLYARLAAIAALLVALAGIAWKLDQNGYKRSQNERTAELLVMSENARLKEKALNLSTERINHEYQITKKRLTDDKRAIDDRLREFAAASADTDTSTASGADDPYRRIARECAAALGILDDYAKGVASKATALQDYAANVCVKQALAQ